MIKLLQENPNRVVSFITFTRTSRRDTDKKLREAVDQKHVGIAHKNFPRVSTLHRFAKSLVHRYAASLGRTENFSVLVTRQGEKNIVLSEVVEDLNVTLDHKELDRAITQFRATGTWPADPQLTESQRMGVIKAFDFLLKFYDTFDMEGLVSTACEILERGASDLPPVLLQVDEYQDLNPKDQELVRLVSAAKSSQVALLWGMMPKAYIACVTRIRMALENYGSPRSGTGCLSENVIDCHRTSAVPPIHSSRTEVT